MKVPDSMGKRGASSDFSFPLLPVCVMGRPMKFLSICLLFSLGGILSAAELGQYQVILDKQLLGRKAPEPPPVTNPTPPPLAAPGWSRQYRMTMMTQDDDDGTVRVGLQNVQDQSSVLLIQGRERAADKDFSLISADYEGGTAQISYLGTTHRFELQMTVAAPPVLKAPAGAAAGRPIQTPAAANNSASRSSIARSALRNRRESRKAESAPLQVRRFASQEELQAHLKEQQMDAIRTGKPPLPIPLTPAMDAQLVREGVLPPLERK